MANGCHFENGFIAVSARILLISMKFGAQMQILLPRTDVPKYQNFASSKWRTPAILEMFFGYISMICCPINAPKFGRKK